MPTRADLALRLRVVANSQRVQMGKRARTVLDEAADSLIKADEELTEARAITRDTLPAGWVWCIVPARSRYATGNDGDPA